MIEQEKPEGFTARFEVVSCFVEWRDEILLLLRQDQKPQPNTWGVPAGKLEGEEDRLQAMVRELKEETGLSINKTDLELLDKVFVSYPDYDFVYHIFRLRLDHQPEITINQQEHQDFRWVQPRQALELNLIKDLDSCLDLIYG